MDKWTQRFLSIAREVSTWSKDPSAQVGAVIVGENRNILATGYNGFPRGIYDYQHRLDNRTEKYKYVVHAEKNCLYNALYNHVDIREATMYVYGLPVCNECSKGILQSGITSVVMQYVEIKNPAWTESLAITKQIFCEANINFEIYSNDKLIGSHSR